MNVLIGSRALAFWYPNYPLSKSADWDIISDTPIEGAEWHDPDILLNREYAERYSSAHDIIFTDASGDKHAVNVMSLRGLAGIKRSHLWRDLSFQKHITHFHKWGLADCINSANFNSFDKELLECRINLTRKLFPQGNPNLMQRKEDFFSDAVTKLYDHDWLHELFAFNDKPLYTKLLRDENLAWCDQEKWLKFTIEEKLQAVAEEAMVIAAERFLIPKDWNYSAKLAFIKAVDKICTTLCSGWFRDFAIDNYPEVLKMFWRERFDVVKRAIESTPENERRFYNGK